MENNYETRLISWCDKICQFFGWDLDKEIEDWDKTGRRRIYPSEGLKKILYKARTEAGIHYGRNISTLYDNISTSDSYYAGWADAVSFSKPSDFEQEAVKEKFAYINLITELVELYRDWEENDFSQLIKTLGSTGIFKDPNFKLHPSILEEVNTIVREDRFKLYKYVDTGESLKSSDRFYISSVIGFSSDLTMWLDHIRKQQDFLEKQSEDDVFVTLFGKIDEVHPIYSNWLFTLHKKGTIWIATDKVGLDNPYQKTARLGRKGLYRERYEHQDSCDLPYYLFEDLEELQQKYSPKNVVKSSFYRRVEITEPATYGTFDAIEDKQNRVIEWFKKQLTGYIDITSHLFYINPIGHGVFQEYENVYAKKDGRIVAHWNSGMSSIIIYDKPEVYLMPHDDLKDGEKAFMLMLVNELIQYHSSEGIEHKHIQLARDFVNNHLLLGTEMDLKTTTKLTYWGDYHKKVFKEIVDTVDTLEENPTRALVKKDYSVVLKSTQYSENWLATPEQLGGLSEWLIADDDRKEIQSRLDKLKKRAKDDEHKLWGMFNEKYSIIYDKLQIASKIEFVGENCPSFGFGRNEAGQMRLGKIEKAEISGVWGKRGWGIGKKMWDEDYCMCCGSYTSRQMIGLHLSNYKELMWLLDLTDRKELPLYFQNYRAHYLVPYGGNSLLDQTHPFNRLYDPCSRAYTNGFIFGFFSCKHCFNKMKFKQEYTTILLDI